MAEVTTETRTRRETCYRLIANMIQARLNCQKSGNVEWLERHTDHLQQIARDILPSGSGVDSGTSIDLDRSTGDRIVLQTSFHHMDDGGYYDGWTEHTITVRADLISEIKITIGGRDRNDIKEYLYQLFEHVLTSTVEETYYADRDRSEFRIVRA